MDNIMGYLDNVNVVVEGSSNNPVDYKNLKELNEAFNRLENIAIYADEEDLTVTEDKVTKLKNKEYNVAEYSGLGRVYLRKNIVDVYIDNQFVIYGVGNSYYLLYAWQNRLYAICNAADDGLIMDHNIIVRDSSYDRDAIRGITDARELGFTESEGVYTIMLPNGTIVTSTELNNISIKYLNEISTEKKNVLQQDMFDIPNTIYHLQYDYDLLGEIINIPEGSLVQFDGGSIKNGTLVGLTTNKSVFWNGIKYVEYDGTTADVKRSGTTSERPVASDIYVGFMYFDTAIGKPIYASVISDSTVTWVDATGATV